MMAQNFAMILHNSWWLAKAVNFKKWHALTEWQQLQLT